jgi:hypothetical protein
MTTLPRKEDFPVGTRFVIKEFDVPLACVPTAGRYAWFNWYGGKPRPYSGESLRVDNNWAADSFEEWVALIEASIHR